jgi:hypothetical protein
MALNSERNGHVDTDRGMMRWTSIQNWT